MTTKKPVRASKKNGSFSRNKGRTAEYAVRDTITALGYPSDRIPASGAAMGFKGDVRVKHPSGDKNKEQTVEVKARRREFTKIYALLKEVINLPLRVNGVNMSLNPVDILEGKTPRALLPPRGSLIPILAKLLKYRANSDILAIKDDRQPFVYLSWETSTEGVPGNG